MVRQCIKYHAALPHPSLKLCRLQLLIKTMCSLHPITRKALYSHLKRQSYVWLTGWLVTAALIGLWWASRCPWCWRATTSSAYSSLAVCECVAECVRVYIMLLKHILSHILTLATSSSTACVCNYVVRSSSHTSRLTRTSAPTLSHTQTLIFKVLPGGFREQKSAELV